MLVIRSLLPAQRFAQGVLWVEVAGQRGAPLFGPVRCRGEADNRYAAEHGNPDEDPTHIGGDHPTGTYRVTGLVRFEPTHVRFPTYGPAFLALDPVSGEAYTAKVLGRRGLGIHGGRLGTGGELRATYGCLRVENEHITVIARLVEDAGLEHTQYVCEIKDLA